jgi:uncharacterized damage-inducible protein DinB
VNIQDIQTLYEYNRWANQRILTTAEKVSADQFAAHTTFSWGSLRGTLVHMVDSEFGWRVLCQDNLLQGFDVLTEANLPTLEAIRRRWAEEEQAMSDYLTSLRDEDLLSIVSYTTDEGIHRERVLWHALFHVVNHGMQHRSEAAAMLTDYGYSPGDLDFTLFLNQRV